MKREQKIKKPFFEIGPKLYLYGRAAVELAKAADRLSAQYGVDVIFSAQYTDLEAIARQTRHIHLFAQHMDPVFPGRGIGAVLPEAIKNAGAEGVLLNHAEKPLSLGDLNHCIQRAKEVGLLTLVCAGDAREAAAVACLGADIVLAESPALIGKGVRGPQDTEEIRRINQAVHQIAPEMPILHGAGIRDEKDVYEIIRAGADATGSTSGILKAENPEEMMEKMIAAVAKAWKERGG